MSAKLIGYNPFGEGTLINTLREWFVGPNEYSSAGKQRAENEKARQHATAERLASEKFNKEEAEIARKWQEEMANTSYQRMVKDLEKAGINPLFAINQGGAAVPSAVSARSHAQPSFASGTRDDMSDFVRLVGIITAGISAASKLNSVAPKTTLNVINSAAPGDLTSAAVLGKGEYQKVLQDLKRQKGVNLKSATRQIKTYNLKQKGIMV